MAKGPLLTTDQCCFSGGEISPRAYGRFDMQHYYNSLKYVENFLSYSIGGALFRPGSIYANEIFSSSAKGNLIPFQFSTTQAYMIEVTNLLFRFYANGGLLTSGGSAVTLVTPFAQAQLFNLHYAQDLDTMYIVNAVYAPQKLTRTSATAFAINPVVFKRGPFRDSNITTTTIAASATTGTITLTASTSIFVAGHVGSLWLLKKTSDVTKTGVVKITVVTNGTTATAVVQDEPDGTAGAVDTAATTYWAEGSFSTYRGFPVSCGFHEGRLYYVMNQTFYGSVSGQYDNFASGSSDSDAVQFAVNAEEANDLRWISSGPNVVEFGSGGGTFSNASNTSTGITPTTPSIHRDTIIGASTMMPKRLSNCLYYIQSNLFNLRELIFDYLTNRENSGDMNDYADHILRDGDGAVCLARQISPSERIWVVRDDGQIAVLTRNVKELVKGWCRIISGSTSAGPGKFEAIGILRGEGDDDQIWVIVKRIVNGATKRYVEYFSSEFFKYDWEPLRLDCSLSLDSPITITGASQTSPIIITAPSHGFSNGDQIKIDNIEGMIELNTNIYIVANAGGNTFELNDEDGNAVDGTLFSSYLDGGQVRKMVSTLSGLAHLNGETVSVVTDGGLPAAQQTYLVTNGSITLKNKAAVIHVGLPYEGKLQLLKLGPPQAQGKTRAIKDIKVRVYRSLGMSIGQDEDNLNEVDFGKPEDPLGHPPTLVTGDLDPSLYSWWDDEAEPVIKKTDPLPLFLLALIIRSEIQEGS